MSVPVDVDAAWETAPGVPLTSPANAPTVTIRRKDTGAAVVTDAAMTEVGDGTFTYSFDPPVLTTEYVAVADGDPLANGQVPATIRYQRGVVNSYDKETWRTLGLDPTDPMNFADNQINSDTNEIDITASGDGETSKRLVRQ